MRIHKFEKWYNHEATQTLKMSLLENLSLLPLCIICYPFDSTISWLQRRASDEDHDEIIDELVTIGIFISVTLVIDDEAGKLEMFFLDNYSFKTFLPLLSKRQSLQQSTQTFDTHRLNFLSLTNQTATNQTSHFYGGFRFV